MTLLDVLAHREKIPLLYADPDPTEWETYLGLAYPVSDKKHYYYAYQRNVGEHLATTSSYGKYLASV